MIEYFLFGITLAFAAVVQPGPLQTFLISQTLERGWEKTLPAVFAPIISDGPIIILVLFFLSKLPLQFLSILQITGGVFLLYLSYNSFLKFKNHLYINKSANSMLPKTLTKAVLVNFLNPHPYLGWSLVMGPLFLKGWNKDPLIGAAFIVGFYFTIIVGLAATIFIASTAKKFGEKSNRLILLLSIAALFCFGIYSIVVGVVGIIKA